MPHDITAQGAGQQEQKDQQLSSNSGPQQTSYVRTYKLETCDQKEVAGLLVPCTVHVCVCVWCGSIQLPPSTWMPRTHVVRSYITCLIQQLKLFLVDGCKNVVYD